MMIPRRVAYAFLLFIIFGIGVTQIMLFGSQDSRPEPNPDIIGKKLFPRSKPFLPALPVDRSAWPPKAVNPSGDIINKPDDYNKQPQQSNVVGVPSAQRPVLSAAGCTDPGSSGFDTLLTTFSLSAQCDGGEMNTVNCFSDSNSDTQNFCFATNAHFKPNTVDMITNCVPQAVLSGVPRMTTTGNMLQCPINRQNSFGIYVPRKNAIDLHAVTVDLVKAYTAARIAKVSLCDQSEITLIYPSRNGFHNSTIADWPTLEFGETKISMGLLNIQFLDEQAQDTLCFATVLTLPTTFNVFSSIPLQDTCAMPEMPTVDNMKIEDWLPAPIVRPTMIEDMAILRDDVRTFFTTMLGSGTATRDDTIDPRYTNQFRVVLLCDPAHPFKDEDTFIHEMRNLFLQTFADGLHVDVLCPKTGSFLPLLSDQTTIGILKHANMLVAPGQGSSAHLAAFSSFLSSGAHVLQLLPKSTHVDTGAQERCDTSILPLIIMRDLRFHCGFNSYEITSASVIDVDAKKTTFNIVRSLTEDNVCYPDVYYQQQHNMDDHRSLAIVVPFRDSSDPSSQGASRTGQLKKLIPYLESFLLQAKRDFIIVISEQSQDFVFNKGATFNAGFKQIAHLVDYVVMHDVDQIPTSSANTYYYPKSPTHLCARSTQFKNGAAYGTMVGGALMLTVEDYITLNGYSNDYWGWGLEDDDMYVRLSGNKMRIIRPPGKEGQYIDLPHPRVKDLDITPLYKHSRAVYRRNEGGGYRNDGLKNVQYRVLNSLNDDSTTAVTREMQHTLRFTVKLGFDWMPNDLTDTALMPDVK